MNDSSSGSGADLPLRQQKFIQNFDGFKNAIKETSNRTPPSNMKRKMIQTTLDAPPSRNRRIDMNAVPTPVSPLMAPRVLSTYAAPSTELVYVRQTDLNLLIQTCAQMATKLDKMSENLVALQTLVESRCGTTEQATTSSGLEKTPSEPAFQFLACQTKDELYLLEEQLGEDEKFCSDFVQYMMQFHSPGSMYKRGKSVMLQIIKLIIGKSLFRDISWTGQTKVVGVVKIAMCKLFNLHKVFFDIVIWSDASTSIDEVHTFFRDRCRNTLQISKCQDLRLSSQRGSRGPRNPNAEEETHQ